MKINIYARFNHTGIGRHAENFTRALMAESAGRFSVHHLDPDNTPALAAALTVQMDNDATIFFVMQRSEFLALFKGKKILWLVFETNRIPTLWREHLKLYDAIWVPSTWGRDVLVNCGVAPEKIHVVPEGVDSKLYSPASVPHEKFVFLCIGKYEKRKGINELIQAFAQGFPAAEFPNVVLRLKADFPMLPQLMAELKQQTAFDKRIEFVEGERSEADIIALYHNADAFIFPSRAEGFGLPCIEAIACGVPLAATNTSGQTEFLRAIDGLFIPINYAMEPIEDFLFDHFYKTIYAGENYGEWARPDINSIIAAMREIYNNPAVWRDNALRAAAIIQERFDWKQSAHIALDKLIYSASVHP
jgi:glycosyltransferase involved in cell wall biosynthesis